MDIMVILGLVVIAAVLFGLAIGAVLILLIMQKNRKKGLGDGDSSLSDVAP